MPSLSTRRPAVWDIFHLIRFIFVVKGLFMGQSGHMAHNRAHGVVVIL
jgi:hypothetical protein